MGCHVGKVTEKLGPADKVEKIGAWQIAHHKYILAEKISYRSGGGGYYTSSGNLIAGHIDYHCRISLVRCSFLRVRIHTGRCQDSL